MWVLAVISILICVALWSNQIRYNINRKRNRRKEKIINKLEKLGSKSNYEEIYDLIIEQYEKSPYNAIEDIVTASKLPRYEKQNVMQVLSKVQDIGVDEKTGLHKQTLTIGRILGYVLALIVVIIYVMIKQFDVSILSVILVYAGMNVAVTFISYIVIETYITNGYQFKLFSSKKEKAETAEDKETTDTDVEGKRYKVIDRIYDLLDTVFGK